LNIAKKIVKVHCNIDLRVVEKIDISLSDDNNECGLLTMIPMKILTDYF